MATILKGDIYSADPYPIIGKATVLRRPLLIVSEESFNTSSGTVIAVDLTSIEPSAGFPLSIKLEATGVPNRTWARPGSIRTYAISKLTGKMGTAPLEAVEQVLEGFNQIVGKQKPKPAKK